MIVLGLTGGISTGKTTVAKLFADKGCKVIDCDVVAKSIVDIGEKQWAEVISVFGKEMLLEDGTLNRGYLGQVVFRDAEKLKLLDSMLHPVVSDIVIDEIEKEKNNPGILVVDAALLIEASLQRHCDAICVTTVEYGLQIERLMRRNNLTREQAEKRAGIQNKLSFSRRYADYVIYNDGSAESLAGMVEAIILDIGERYA
jgi:dephospho-CoA kinase